MGKKVKIKKLPIGSFLFDFYIITVKIILHLEKQYIKDKIMSEKNKIILCQCSLEQADKIQKLLADKWIIDEYDESSGHVLMKKGCDIQWVKRDGHTCLV